jgi:RNA polymerase sigma factor (sigma-70 family)
MGERDGLWTRQVRVLFGGGTTAGLTDAQLLERFAARRDEVGAAAFEALVARHGAMVWGVCRHLLRDPHAAEDAFQATFLVLVRKARGLKVGDSLGGWLHGVTHRVAARARADALKRERRECTGEGLPFEPAADGDELDHIDLRPVLHEELARLPEKYRAPLVLCYLEGLTHDEAAARLRWPVGTVRGRLARAREQLRGRLARRGLGVGAGAGAIAAVLAGEARAAVPPALVSSTVHAATGTAAGGLLAAGAVPAAAVALSQGVIRAMTLAKLKLAGAVLLTTGLVAGGAGVIARGGIGDDRKPSDHPTPAPVGAFAIDGPAPPAPDVPAVPDRRARIEEEIRSLQRLAESDDIGPVGRDQIRSLILTLRDQLAVQAAKARGGAETTRPPAPDLPPTTEPSVALPPPKPNSLDVLAPLPAASNPLDLPPGPRVEPPSGNVLEPIAAPSLPPQPRKPGSPSPEPTAVLDRSISLHVENQSLTSALEEVSKNTGLVISYDLAGLARKGMSFARGPDGLMVTNTVMLDARDVPVREVLRRLLEPLHLGYQVESNLVTITGAERAAPLAPGSALNRFVKPAPPLPRSAPATTPPVALPPAVSPRHTPAPEKPAPRQAIPVPPNPAAELPATPSPDRPSAGLLPEAPTENSALVVDKGPADPNKSYLDKLRGEVERRLSSTMKEFLDLQARSRKVQADLKTFAALDAALKTGQKTSLAAADHQLVPVVPPDGAAALPVEGYLAATRHEIASATEKLNTESREIAQKVEQAKRDFARLRALLVPLAGGEEQAVRRLTELREPLAASSGTTNITALPGTSGDVGVVYSVEQPSEDVQILDRMIYQPSGPAEDAAMGYIKRLDGRPVESAPAARPRSADELPSQRR